MTDENTTEILVDMHREAQHALHLHFFSSHKVFRCLVRCW